MLIYHATLYALIYTTSSYFVYYHYSQKYQSPLSLTDKKVIIGNHFLIYLFFTNQRSPFLNWVYPLISKYITQLYFTACFTTHSTIMPERALLPFRLEAFRIPAASFYILALHYISITLRYIALSTMLLCIIVVSALHSDIVK